MKIRHATLDDVKNITKVRQKTWDTTYRGIYPDELIDNFDYQKEENKFINLINSKDVEVYVLCDEANVVGVMTIGIPYHPYLNYEQELGMLYILSEYQHLGFGTKLFNIARDVVKNNGYHKMLVSCNKYNINSLKFYEKMGGKIIHIDPDSEDKRYVQVKFHYDIN